MIDYSLYLVTDRTIAGDRPLVDIVSAGVAGGVSCVQLREKNCSTQEFIHEASLLLELLQPLDIPLIINDRVDVALAVGANGVHLGQNDMSIADARRITSDNMIIGISAESLEDAINAEESGADYIGISPVFTTATKLDIATPLGLAGVREIRRAVKIPLVGIGGIDTSNTRDVIEAGANGVAVVSAIMAATNPKRAAENIRKTMSSVTTPERKLKNKGQSNE